MPHVQYYLWRAIRRLQCEAIGLHQGLPGRLPEHSCHRHLLPRLARTMGIEIERRFLLADHSILHNQSGVPIIQGYLNKEAGELSTRIRIAGEHAWLSLKSPRQGLVRSEYEYEIPLADARVLIEKHCAGRMLRKIRHTLPWEGISFVVDVFLGPLAGLAIVETELNHPAQAFPVPPWLGREISLDRRYGNRALATSGLPDDFRSAQSTNATHILLCTDLPPTTRPEN